LWTHARLRQSGSVLISPGLVKNPSRFLFRSSLLDWGPEGKTRKGTMNENDKIESDETTGTRGTLTVRKPGRMVAGHAARPA
jgi:hypothetical protein